MKTLILSVLALSFTNSAFASPSSFKGKCAKQALDAAVMKWAFLAAAISVGLGSVGTGIAVAYVGSAALGVVGEKPEMAPRALIFVGLAEGIAIYGLIIAIMILVRV